MKGLKEPLQDLLDTLINSGANSKAPVYGIQLGLKSDNQALTVSTGYTDKTQSQAISPEHPIRIASNTKTFVAAAILRLYESDLLDIDQVIKRYLPDHYNRLLVNAGYRMDKITVRHLLTHTSGLFDYADCPAFEAIYHKEPQHSWTRLEQLQLAMQQGSPYGEPGEIYRYSDTGYILLGEIIEQVSGLSLGRALRALLSYERLQLASTWLEVDEPAPESLQSRVHQYVGIKDFYHHHASYDIFGGGGLASTVVDMAQFIQSLFTGQVYNSPSTLKTMLSTVAATRGGPVAYGEAEQVPGVYRMGIEQEEEPLLHYGHGGFLGTYAGYCPVVKTAFAFSVNQHDSKLLKEGLCREIIYCLTGLLNSGDGSVQREKVL